MAVVWQTCLPCLKNVLLFCWIKVIPVEIVLHKLIVYRTWTTPSAPALNSLWHPLTSRLRNQYWTTLLTLYKESAGGRQVRSLHICNYVCFSQRIVSWEMTLFLCSFETNGERWCQVQRRKHKSCTTVRWPGRRQRFFVSCRVGKLP